MNIIEKKKFCVKKFHIVLKAKAKEEEKIEERNGYLQRIASWWVCEFKFIISRIIVFIIYIFSCKGSFHVFVFVCHDSSYTKKYNNPLSKLGN